MDIQALLKPRAGGTRDRRTWGISVNSVIVPFLTALKTKGEYHTSAEALGCPIVLRKAKDGTPKFNDNGRPSEMVVKEISDVVNLMRENYTQGLVDYTASVQGELPDRYAEVVAEAKVKGQVVADHDKATLQAYAEAQAEAEAITQGEKVLAGVS